MYYVCTECGLKIHLQQYAREKDKRTKKRWQSELGEGEEDFRKKRHQNDMVKWFTKSQDM